MKKIIIIITIIIILVIGIIYFITSSINKSQPVNIIIQSDIQPIIFITLDDSITFNPNQYRQLLRILGEADMLAMISESYSDSSRFEYIDSIDNYKFTYYYTCPFKLHRIIIRDLRIANIEVCLCRFETFKENLIIY